MEIAGEPVCSLLAEGDDALLAALAAHVEQLLLEVHVAEIEADRFLAPQPRRVHELEQGAIADGEGIVTFHRGEETFDVFAVGSVRQPAWTAWRERGVRYARRSEREAQEASDRRELAPDGRRRELARSRTAELGGVVRERPHVGGLELRAAPLQPVGELADVDRVRTARPVGERRRGEEAVDGGVDLHADVFAPRGASPLSSGRARRGAARKRRNPSAGQVAGCSGPSAGLPRA